MKTLLLLLTLASTFAEEPSAPKSPYDPRWHTFLYSDFRTVKIWRPVDRQWIHLIHGYTRDGKLEWEVGGDGILIDHRKPSPTIPEGCEPFDLAKALAGAKLRTRSGLEVRGFRKAIWGEGASSDFYALVNGEKNRFDDNGKVGFSTEPHRLDLFLVKEPAIAWLFITKVFPNRAQAESWACRMVEIQQSEPLPQWSIRYETNSVGNVVGIVERVK